MSAIQPEIKLLPKQRIVFDLWQDNVSTEILMGGSKGGSKSYTGVGLIWMNALLYPGTHYFIARKNLSDLREHTIPSIHEWFERSNLRVEDYAKYNGQDNYFKLTNSSRVSLIHAKDEPRDPLFERFGSMQHTQGWLEEAGELEAAVYRNLRISVGRWKNREYNLLGKLFITCNPKKGWLYDEFYLPNKEGRLPDYRKFVQTYPDENPFLTEDYLGNLRRLEHDDPVAYQRLYKGNWEYAEDHLCLFEYDDIAALFKRSEDIKPDKTNIYMTVDPSGKGKDRTVIMVFMGRRWVDRVFSFADIRSDQLISTIKEIQKSYGIPNAKVIYDEVGLGYYIGDYIKGSFRFNGGARAMGSLGRKDYPNIRTQMYYLLRKDVGRKELFINERRHPVIQEIVRDLSAIRADKVDEDGKKFIQKKEEIRKQLKASPDYADCLMMSRLPVGRSTQSYAA